MTPARWVDHMKRGMADGSIAFLSQPGSSSGEADVSEASLQEVAQTRGHGWSCTYCGLDGNDLGDRSSCSQCGAVTWLFDTDNGRMWYGVACGHDVLVSEALP